MRMKFISEDEIDKATLELVKTGQVKMNVVITA